MMASPLIKVPGTAAALDWTTKTGIQAEIGVDLLSPDVFSTLVAYFDNKDIAGSSVSTVSPEKELAADDLAAIKNRVNFLLGDSISAKLVSDTASSHVSLSGADVSVALTLPLQGDPVDLMVARRLLPFAIGNALSISGAPNDIQLSVPQISGDIAPNFEMTLETFLVNLHELTSDLLPKDELNEPFNIANLLSAHNDQDAFFGIAVSEQGAVFSQASPSALQLGEGTLTSALPLGDKKLTLTANPPSAPQLGNGTLTSALPLGDKKLTLTANPPSAPQLGNGTLTSALPLGDKKLTLTANPPSAPQLGNGTLTSVLPLGDKKLTLTANPPSAPQFGNGTLTSALPLGDKSKNIGTSSKLIIEDQPVVPPRTVASVGAILLPEEDASQTVGSTILRYSGLQAAAAGALPNTGLEVEAGLGKNHSAFASPSAAMTPQAATSPYILTQPAMFDLTRHVATSPDRMLPSAPSASALEAAAAIAGVDATPSGTGGQSQSGNAHTGTGTNSQQGMAQSQALAAVLDVQRQGWTKALVNRAMSMVQSGGTMTFKIMPAHLGLITLKMSEGRRGTDLRIVADVAATASMLRDVKHQISSVFESAGITLGEYSAGTSNRGDKGSTSQNHDKAESGPELETKLNQDVAEFSDYSGDDRSNINIIL
jgi:hypothetical protein